MIIIRDVEQGTDEWLRMRAGCITASRFGDILTPLGKITSGETRKNYLYSVAAGRISGDPEETFKSKWMDRGNDFESEARALFEFQHCVSVEQVALIFLDERREISCSPDGLHSCRGVELKCPKLSTQIRRVLDGKMPTVYIPQVQGNMWVYGADSWDFMSYHPAVKPFHVVVERDDNYIKLLSEAVEEANAQVNKICGMVAS